MGRSRQEEVKYCKQGGTRGQNMIVNSILDVGILETLQSESCLQFGV